MEYPQEPLDLSKKQLWIKNEECIKSRYFDNIVYCVLSQKQGFEAITSQNTKCWVEHHLASGYPLYDPVVKVGKFCNEKKILANLDASNPVAKRIMQERYDYGMKNGMTPILDRQGNNRAWFTVGGDLSDKDIRGIYFDGKVDDFFKDIHISMVRNHLMETTHFSFEVCLVMALSLYEKNYKSIAERAGLTETEVIHILADLYRLADIKANWGVTCGRP